MNRKFKRTAFTWNGKVFNVTFDWFNAEYEYSFLWTVNTCQAFSLVAVAKKKKREKNLIYRQWLLFWLAISPKTFYGINQSGLLKSDFCQYLWGYIVTLLLKLSMHVL